MGGSLIVDNIAPTPYNLEMGLLEIYTILSIISYHYPGWCPDVAVEEYLAGSSSVAIDNRIALRNRGIELGDIDILVNKESYDLFCSTMERIANTSKESKFNTILYFRRGKIRSTSLMRVSEFVRQVDFIPCEFENGKPKQFFRFSHSSHIADTSIGVKGFAHKLLCRAYTAGTKYHFSVDYGLREDGSFVYDTDFISVVNKLFECNAYQTWSFIGLLNELNNKPAQRQKEILQKFGNLVFGPTRQKTSRFKDKDLANLTAVYNCLDSREMLTDDIAKMFSVRKQELE